jgi:hypothetical protein
MKALFNGGIIRLIALASVAVLLAALVGNTTWH